MPPPHAYSSSKLILMVYPLALPMPSGTGAILRTRRAASMTDWSMIGLPLGFASEKALMVPSRSMVIFSTVVKSCLCSVGMEVGCSHWL